MFFILLALSVILSPVHAQNPQETLTQYIADLQKNPGDNALREKIIKFTLDMKQKPAIPPEVIKDVGAAEYAIKNAKTEADYADAAREYEKALLAAPWLAQAYYDCGLAYEKAGKLKEAIAAFSFYLMAAPDAKDAQTVQKEIGGLEYGMKKAAKEKAAEVQKKTANEDIAAQLVGVWHQHPSTAGVNGYRLRITADGPMVTVTVIGTPSSNGSYSPANQLWMEGEIKEGKIVGTYTNFGFNSRGITVWGTEPFEMKIVVSDDGSKFAIGKNGWKDVGSVYLKE